MTEANWRDALEIEPQFAISETPAFVGRTVVAPAADAQRARWRCQALSSGQLAQVYGFTDLDGSALIHQPGDSLLAGHQRMSRKDWTR